jgi:hypothetical protein
LQSLQPSLWSSLGSLALSRSSISKSDREVLTLSDADSGSTVYDIIVPTGANYFSFMALIGLYVFQNSRDLVADSPGGP